MKISLLGWLMIIGIFAAVTILIHLIKWIYGMMKKGKDMRLLILSTFFFGACALCLWEGLLFINGNPQLFHNNKLFKHYKSERFSILKSFPSLGVQGNVDILGKENIGPISKGRLISSYTLDSIHSYHESYWRQYYTYKPIYEDTPGLNDVERALLILKARIRPIKYIKQTEKKLAYRVRMESFKRTFAIYDISELIPFGENEDSTYCQIMEELKAKVSNYEPSYFNGFDYKSAIIQSLYKAPYEGRIKGIAFTIKSPGSDGTDIIYRNYYLANRRAYVLEVHANHGGKELVYEFLSNITTLDLWGYNHSLVTKMVCCLVLILFLSFSFVYYAIKPYRGLPVKNKHARRFSMFSFGMTLLNILIICALLIIIFSNSDYQFVYDGEKYIDLDIVTFLIVATFVVMSLLICPYLYIKSKRDYRYDYLISDKLQPYFDSRLVPSEKKTLVSLFYYPLFILGLLPLGIIVLVYAIPYALILVASLEIRNLYKWINKDESLDELNLSFIDYYVVLNLKMGATNDEVDKAFNSAMVKYNSANGNPLYGRQFYNNVQESYAILSSTNQLRPDYDKEYEAYKASNSLSYSYSNKQLKNEILNFRKKLHKVKSRNSGPNIIIVSFILLVITFIGLRLTDVIPPL